MRKFEFSISKQNNVDAIKYVLGVADVYDDRAADKSTQMSNIIPLQYIDEDGKRSITSYAHEDTTLAMMMKSKLTKKEVLCILSGVASAYEIGAQGIPISYIVKDTNYVYINKETLAVKCMIVPVKQDVMPMGEIPVFFREILSGMMFDEGDTDNYVARLLTSINAADFSVGKLKQLIDGELNKMGIILDKDGGIVKPDAPAANNVKVNKLGVMNAMASQQAPMMGQRPPMPNGQAPMMGQRPPMPNGQAPMMGQRPPMPNGQAPMMGQPPMPNGQAPMMGQPPMPNGQAPMMGQRPPMPNGQAPMMGQRPPMPNGQAPMMGQRPPMPNGQAPMMGQPPMSNGQAPMMGQRPPMPNGQAPMMGQRPPMPNGQAPMMGQAPVAPQPQAAPAPQPQAAPVAPQPQSAPVPPQPQAAPVPKPQAAPAPPKPQAAPVPPKPQAAPVPPQPQAAPAPQPQAAPVAPQPQAAPVAPQPQEIEHGSLVGQLGNVSKPVPHIIRKKTGETIYINKPEFSIGKSKTKADYPLEDNSAISRVHCIIVQKDGVNYLKDNNSTNHTFLNGVELEPGVEMLLKHKSVIQMGDEEFTFLLRKGD